MAIRNWYIGCSGFYYREWKDAFYPLGLPQKDWFAYYCQHFNTIEINNTFYRFPQLKSLQGWFNKSPKDFVFTVKAPKGITHYKKFEGSEELVKQFYDIVANGLAQKLGAVLFQLPPSLQFSEDKMNAIFRQMDNAFTNIVEFRHNSWWRKDVIKAFNQRNICFCGQSYPGLNDDVIVSKPVSYYRFHGVPKLYYSPYENDFLDDVVQKLKKARGIEKAFLYFNNTASMAAIDNAKYVKSIVE